MRAAATNRARAATFRAARVELHRDFIMPPVTLRGERGRWRYYSCSTGDDSVPLWFVEGDERDRYATAGASVECAGRARVSQSWTKTCSKYVAARASWMMSVASRFWLTPLLDQF